MSKAYTENVTFELEGEEQPKTYGKFEVNIESKNKPFLNGTDDKTIVDINEDSTTYLNESEESSNIIVHLRAAIYGLGIKHTKVLKACFVVLVFALYHVYLVAAIRYTASEGIEISWCDGLGFLIILTGFVYWTLFYYFILKKYVGKRLKRHFTKAISRFWQPLWSKKFAKIGFAVIIIAGVIVFLVLDSEGQRRRLISAVGGVVIILICWLVSKHPGKVVWRHIFWGLGIQFVMALLILRWEGGRNVLDCISTKVQSRFKSNWLTHVNMQMTTFLDFSNAGSSFIYSYLATGSPNVSIIFDEEGSPVSKSALITLPGIFVFQGLSVIYFFGFVVSLLYHVGVMTAIVAKLGWFLQITIGTTAAESMNAAANIFLGMSEAPLLVRPFLPEMTLSELHAVMTGGFATIAGTVMGAYISFGIDAGYLLSASVMAAPAALGLSKLVYPETEKSNTTSDKIKHINTKTEGNLLDAAAQGAIQGIILVGCIVANLIAFISFIQFLNTILTWFGGLVGADYISFEHILGKIFIPVAWIMGVHWEECEDVALLLGLKIVVNEFVAYERLVTRMSYLSERSKGIATYALCSFANITSIGIQLGGLGALAPSRRADLAKTVWRALLAGIASSLLNGCVAGMLLTANDYGES